MQRLPDDLVGDMRAIEIRRINMIYAGRDRLAQDGDGGVGDPWAARKRPGRTQLHRAITPSVEPSDDMRERERAAERDIILCLIHGVILSCGNHERI